MDQIEIFPPASRTKDPRSSHEAEREITMNGRRKQQLKICLELVKDHPHHTSKELSEYGHLDRFQIARRLPELETFGLVRKGRQRRCRVGGRLSVTWGAIWK